MSRWVSLIVLLVVIVVITAFFIRVMAEFLVPLFMATLLVVIFRPLHLWILAKMPARPAVAAFLTTTTVSLVVVLPFAIMVVMAAAEGREIIKRFDRAVLLQKLSDFRGTLGLNLPHSGHLLQLERQLIDLRQNLQQFDGSTPIATLRPLERQHRDALLRALQELEEKSRTVGSLNGLRWAPDIEELAAADEDGSQALSADRPGESLQPTEAITTAERNATTIAVREGELSQAPDPSDATEAALATDRTDDFASDPSAGESTDPQVDKDSDEVEEVEKESFFGFSLPTFAADPSVGIPRWQRISGTTALEQQWFVYVFQLEETRLWLTSEQWQENPEENREMEVRLRSLVASCHASFREFKVKLLGGPVSAWIKETVNPQDDELDQYSTTVLEFVKDNFVSWGGVVSLYLGRLLFGATIIVIALYFFLLDGPRMMKTVIQLSPMDNRHEQELIAEFDRVSRAVVVATLAAAIAQGLLAGLGFYFTGIQSVFLLTILTMLLAMIPFLGAASVWFPVVVYVAFFENRPVAAGVLFLYSALIVSTIDNIIKPYILHGQSNLHPLLALLSVIGGVTALGPIGILLGPMLVVFLQTLLKILKDEILNLDQTPQAAESNGGSANESPDETSEEAAKDSDKASPAASAKSSENRLGPGDADSPPTRGKRQRGSSGRRR